MDGPNWRLNRASDTPPASGLPRTQTIEFAPQDISPRRRRNVALVHAGRTLDTHPDVHDGEPFYARTARISSGSRGVPRTSTLHTVRPSVVAAPTTGGLVTLSPAGARDDVGFGGFPMPHQILGKLISKISPSLSRRVQRTISMPVRTVTIGSQAAIATGTVRTGLGIDAPVKSVPYISFDAVVGRNSNFHDLTREELEELGGVEYRALELLLWLVPVVRSSIHFDVFIVYGTDSFASQYHFGVQLLALSVIAPTVAAKWQAVLRAQIRYITPGWYA